MGDTPAKRTPARATNEDTTTSTAPADTTRAPEAPAQGTDEVVQGAEHVTGSDPRRDLHHTGYHDSLTGRPVNEQGHFADTATPGSEERVPQHRIVADDWPDREKHTKDSAKKDADR